MEPDAARGPRGLAAAAREPQAAGAGHERGRLRLCAGRRHLARVAGRARSTPGRLAASGDPRGWDRAGEITPIQRTARAFSGWGLQGLDGTAWYHPRRLTIDSGAVAAGNANPAQAVLDVHATHGHDLGRIPIYAFGAALGGQRVLDGAQLLATQNGIPASKLTLGQPLDDLHAQRP